MNETPTQQEKNKSRRDFLSGFGIATGIAATISALGTHKKSYADIVGGDTAVLTEISIWLKTTWATQVIPLLKIIKDWYDTTKSWIGSWNEFVSKFNHGMSVAENIRNFLVRQEDNWLYQTYVQLKEYVNGMMRIDGDIFKYRLHYLDPILIQKIDSMMFEIQSLVREAESVAKSYGKQSDDSFFRQSKTGKSAIRATNDQAKYLESISRISAIRQTVESTKIKLEEFSQKNQTMDNTGKLYRDLTSPQMLEVQLLQCSLLAEIYAKMNDFFLIMIQKDPIVTQKEKVLKPSDLKDFVQNLQNPNSQSKKKNGFLF